MTVMVCFFLKKDINQESCYNAIARLFEYGSGGIGKIIKLNTVIAVNSQVFKSKH